MSPAKTPPSNLLGAPGERLAAWIDDRLDAGRRAPCGALANHSRPKALLIEMPSGLLTDGCAALVAAGVRDAVEERERFAP